MSENIHIRHSVAFLSLFGLVVSSAVLGFQIAEPKIGGMAGHFSVYVITLVICGISFVHAIVRMAIAGEIGAPPGSPRLKPIVLMILTFGSVTLISILVVNAMFGSVDHSLSERVR